MRHTTKLNLKYYLKCVGVLFRLVSIGSILFLIFYLGYWDLTGILISLSVGAISEAMLRVCCYFYKNL